MLPSRWPGILDRVSARPRPSAASEHQPRPCPVRVRGARFAPVLGTLAVLAAAVACSSSPASVSPLTPSAATSQRAAAARAHQAVAAAPRPIPSGPPGVTVSRTRTPDGSVVTVAVIHGSVRYALHDGSQDPAGRYAALVQDGPAVTGAERRRLLAAFNGGFLMHSRAGGYEQEGHVFVALRRGLASLVIDRSGLARIGVWGSTVPAPGEAVYSVRQNLWLLVSNGQPTAESARWWRWGGTIGHAEYVARSALGQNAAGDLIYAASMSTTPHDLAVALARSGARTGMELDINPEWVQLAVAATPGGPLSAPIPGQVRPATQYLTGWTRDFIAVLAPAR
jgi:predicted secreted protein